jgi:hypothetical protein
LTDRKAAPPSPLALLAHPHPLRLAQAFARIDDKVTRRALMILAEGIARWSSGTDMRDRGNAGAWFASTLSAASAAALPK